MRPKAQIQTYTRSVINPGLSQWVVIVNGPHWELDSKKLQGIVSLGWLQAYSIGKRISQVTLHYSKHQLLMSKIILWESGVGIAFSPQIMSDWGGDQSSYQQRLLHIDKQLHTQRNGIRKTSRRLYYHHKSYDRGESNHQFPFNRGHSNLPFR